MAQPRRIQKLTTLQARSDGTLRLAVVADTHSVPHPALAGHLKAMAPDAILHAGDIGDLRVLDGLAELAPVLAVRGNIDEKVKDLPDVLTIEVMGTKEPILRMLLLHIALYGPWLRADIARLAKSERASLVVCGHSHVPFLGEHRGITMFNPGSIGPRREQLPILFGKLELSPSGVRLAHLEAETAKPWFPP